MKNSFFNNLCIFISVLMVGLVFANPDFDSDGDGQYDGLPSFDFDMNVTAVIDGGSIGIAGEDYLVGMIGDVIHGVGIGSSIPFGDYAGGVAYFTTIGNQSLNSDVISFYFYNTED